VLQSSLQARGITHVYVNFSELSRLQHSYNYMLDANWNLIQDTLRHHATDIHRMGRGVVYELSEK
jgi:hypothetical protein